MTELAVVGADVAGGASPQPDHDIAATVAAIIRNAVVR
jgi:hypothetical protein